MSSNQEAELGAVITATVVFFGCWAACAYHYGFLLGFGLGWIPALILAGICAAMWKFIWAVLGLIVLVVGYQFVHRNG